MSPATSGPRCPPPMELLAPQPLGVELRSAACCLEFEDAWWPRSAFGAQGLPPAIVLRLSSSHTNCLEFWARAAMPAFAPDGRRSKREMLPSEEERASRAACCDAASSLRACTRAASMALGALAVERRPGCPPGPPGPLTLVDAEARRAGLRGVKGCSALPGPAAASAAGGLSDGKSSARLPVGVSERPNNVEPVIAGCGNVPGPMVPLALP
mmetsp:Transcript_6109/g.18992  ORF Transcript_6109/g.18992 Transcript_6109/m.18992 type:complete len:212 (+) Transcript_6109:994-1629(+)